MRLNQKGILVSSAMFVGTAVLVACLGHADALRAEKARAVLAENRNRLTAILPAAANQQWADEGVKALLRTLMSELEKENERAAAERNAREQDDGTFGLTRVMKDPKLQSAYFRSVRAENALKLGAFFQGQHLTSEQSVKMLDARVKFREIEQDLLATKLAQDPDAARDPGVLMLIEMQDATAYFATKDPAIATLYENAHADLRDTEQAIVGLENYQHLQDYERSALLREGVQRVAAAAAMIGNPLTAEQSEQLVLALVNSATGTPVAGHRIDRDSIDWNKAEVQANEILSPAQMDLFSRTDLVRMGEWQPSLNRAIREALFAKPAEK
jgi:hypothetical protein